MYKNDTRAGIRRVTQAAYNKSGGGDRRVRKIEILVPAVRDGHVVASFPGGDGSGYGGMDARGETLAGARARPPNHSNVPSIYIYKPNAHKRFYVYVVVRVFVCVCVCIQQPRIPRFDAAPLAVVKALDARRR